MALARAKIQPTIEEKRLITLNFLESSFVGGNEVTITPVDTYSITDLSGEEYTYLDPVTTYITFDERPSVKLLKEYGWYREDADIQPTIAYIPTHLLYSKETGEVINEVLLDGNDYQALVKTGESLNYILKELKVIRGTLVDIPYDFLIKYKDNEIVVNRFYVTDVKVDIVSINYVVNLMPYKYEHEQEGQEDGNTPYVNIDTEDYGI